MCDAFATNPRCPIWPALPSLLEHCPSQQIDGQVPVLEQWHEVVLSKLGQANWVSMLELKTGFHSIPFKHASSYNLTFVMHLSKFKWLRMPLSLK